MPRRPSPSGSCASSPARVSAATASRSIPSTSPGRRASSAWPHEFIELAGKINQYMPYHCAERVEQALNDVTKPVKGSRILILGGELQGRRRRHPRVTRAQDHRGPGQPRRHRQLSRRVRAVAPNARARERATRRRRLSGRRRRPGHGSSPDRSHMSIAARSALFVDLRGVTRGLRVENLVRL